MSIDTYLNQMAPGSREGDSDDLCVVELLFDTPKGRAEIEAAVAHAVRGQTVEIEAALEDDESGRGRRLVRHLSGAEA